MCYNQMVKSFRAKYITSVLGVTWSHMGKLLRLSRFGCRLYLLMLSVYHTSWQNSIKMGLSHIVM